MALLGWLFVCHLISLVYAKSLWSTVPANFSTIIQTAYPIGNARLAALPFGEAGHEKLSLNRDSLWTGGPFETTSYNGGNPLSPRSQYLPGIRDWIWQNGTGNASKLMGDDDNYGSYAVLGNLSVRIAEMRNGTNYVRALDLQSGIHTTTFRSGSSAFTIQTFCSYPDDVCVYHINSTHALPAVTVAFENVQSTASLVSSSCSQGQVNLDGITQAGIGMTYKASARLLQHDIQSHCLNDTLTIESNGQSQLTIVLAAGTNYDETHGTAAFNYSFRGVDPEPYVQSVIDAATRKTPSQLLATHIADHGALMGAFELSLPDTQNSSGVETAELIARYDADSTAGDPYLEALVFDYGRYLFISSSRDNSLPANLQGKWAYGLSNAWGADYHLDINLQMNHWPVVQTGLGDLQTALWRFMIETWAPRGAETAKLLYDAPAWVVHDEINIFGYSAMKTGDDYWADYPVSATWMMQHVWDYFDYSQDVAWLQSTGYPLLLNPIAQFWLSQLQQDQYFHDGTLVVNPCNSPEHGPTTFGCTHWQQLIHQLLETTLQSATLVNHTDTTCLSTLQTSLSQLDKGLHIGSWNQIQEWKLDLDVQNDTHRHLSNLIGWYPGWSLSSYSSGYTNATIQAAVATTLWSRGPGIADANAGWEKVWRAACWARLNETERAYYELRLTIQENWAPNALSMYSGKQEPFQIDANFGFAGAVLGMLVVDLPGRSGAVDGTRTVVLGPAIPDAWGVGRVRGVRLRGGGAVDFAWNARGLVTKVNVTHGCRGDVLLVNKNGEVLAQAGKG
ncbi:glycoside hydrolase family 95 protein [Teratosphaeria nubilosa]|uniref:Glycoside hydrolase family 95 protein n=1 Tax=Teratosphaeria nubilosa TaxID=161662 RepID=A0A6G1LIQ9_9PEZI|nr:glycoside hydrolase family 95 protein [Teratosphaeria nubilosa]